MVVIRQVSLLYVKTESTDALNVSIFFVWLTAELFQILLSLARKEVSLEICALTLLLTDPSLHRMKPRCVKSLTAANRFWHTLIAGGGR